MYTGVNAANCRAPAGLVRELTQVQRDQILALHNDRRRTVAKGLQRPQPEAADMVKLVNKKWNIKLD
jgi:hypothetical protein